MAKFKENCIYNSLIHCHTYRSTVGSHVVALVAGEPPLLADLVLVLVLDPHLLLLRLVRAAVVGAVVQGTVGMAHSLIRLHFEGKIIF